MATEEVNKLTAFAGEFNAHSQPFAKDWPTFSVDSPPNSIPCQRILSHRIENIRLQNLLDDVEATAEKKARLRSCAAPHASSYLNATPYKHIQLNCTSVLFITILRHRLGVPLLPKSDQPPIPCPSCDKAVLDDYGYHALTCKSDGGIVTRHNRIRDTFFDMAKAARLNPKREVQTLLGSAERTADVFIPNLFGSTAGVLDFAVTHCLQPKTLSIASKEGGAAATSYAETKCKSKNDIQQRVNSAPTISQRFCPMVVDVFGAWDPAAHLIFSKVASPLAIDSGYCYASTINYIYQRMSMTLMRANAEAILKRFPPPHDLLLLLQ